MRHQYGTLTASHPHLFGELGNPPALGPQWVVIGLNEPNVPVCGYHQV